MYCKECGKEIDNDSKFCSYCGTKQPLKQVPENKTELSSEPGPVTQNVNISLSFKKPFSKNENKEVKNGIISHPNYMDEKNDPTYKKEIKVTIIGIIALLVLSAISAIVRAAGDPSYYETYWVSIIVCWICAIFWVVNIAKRQNRSTSGWGTFAFFLPFFAIIIIGLQKKLIYPRDFGKYTKKERSTFLNNYSIKLLRSQRIDFAEYIINKALEIDPDNHFAYDTRGYIFYQKNDFKTAIENYSTSIKMDDSIGEKFYNRALAKHKYNDINGAISDLKKAVELGFAKADDYLQNLNSDTSNHF